LNKIKLIKIARTLLVFIFISSLSAISLTSEVSARAGGGRSSGRSAGFAPRRSSPPPSQSAPHNYSNPTPPPSQAPINNQPMPNRGGGFMRGLAGGVAGGFLGSMLFSSMGHSAGFDGGGNGGGFGLLEIILMVGIGFFGFRWWKNRNAGTAATYGRESTGFRNDYQSQDPFPVVEAAAVPVKALPTSTISSDEASDIFFKVQGAWTRRDLSSVKNLLGPEMENILGQDLRDLKSKNQINRLENISVRRTEVSDPWQDGGLDYSTVHFGANLLDYTVDETTGNIVTGNDVTPVKFDENWTFAKSPVSAQWTLVGIEQVQ
jgi:predicted lipid-binding transport protein (Tim44 family)